MNILEGVDNCNIDLQAKKLKIKIQFIYGLEFKHIDYDQVFHSSKVQVIKHLPCKNTESELQKFCKILQTM